MALLPFDDRDGVIWMNGEMIEWRDARTHTLTHALHYGSQVFEGERAYGGTVFKGREHTLRLRKSCQYLDFDLPVSDAELDQIKDDVLAANNIVDGYIRAFCWRGSEMMAISAQDTKIHLAVAAWQWPSYFDPEVKMKGITMDVSDWQRPSAQSAPVHAKAAGLYMICTLSKHNAEQKGFQDSLMLDWRGYIAEATGANVFFLMKDGSLHTPTPDCFLNGITRQTVIDMARARGIEVVERHMRPEDMADAAECFLTGTAAEVTPVRQIADYHFTPGETTRALVDGYADLVNGRA